MGRGSTIKLVTEERRKKGGKTEFECRQCRGNKRKEELDYTDGKRECQLVTWSKKKKKKQKKKNGKSTKKKGK